MSTTVRTLALAVAALLIGLAAGYAVASLDNGSADSRTDTSEELDQREAELDRREADLQAREMELATSELQQAVNSVPRAGIVVVGTDVAPGTFRTTDNTSCTWRRLNGTTGAPAEVIADGVIEGTGEVTIAPDDAAFESIGCNAWTRVG